jgi:hypothetical protein
MCASDGAWVDSRRADRNCSRLDYRGPWTGREWRAVHLGASKRYDLMSKSFAEVERITGVIGFDPHNPSESPLDGCPKGWALCRFVQSIRPYYRRRMGDTRVESLRPRPPDDPLLEECLRIAESEEQAAQGRFDVERFRVRS